MILLQRTLGKFLRLCLGRCYSHTNQGMQHSGLFQTIDFQDKYSSDMRGLRAVTVLGGGMCDNELPSVDLTAKNS